MKLAAILMVSIGGVGLVLGFALMRVKGKGAPRLKGSGRGDVIARVRIEVPKRLSKKERELLEQLQEAGK